MAKHILKFRKADKDIFEDIRSGAKSVETRAATVKHKNIKPGDTVVFICGRDKFEKKVKSAEIFKNVSELLSKHKIKDIAPRLSTAEELIAMYRSFPGYEEKIKKFGLVASEFDRVD